MNNNYQQPQQQPYYNNYQPMPKGPSFLDKIYGKCEGFLENFTKWVSFIMLCLSPLALLIGLVKTILSIFDFYFLTTLNTLTGAVSSAASYLFMGLILIVIKKYLSSHKN